MQEKKVRLTIEITREMLLDLMVMTSERTRKIIDASDTFAEEGCVHTAKQYRLYAEGMCELNAELSEIYEKEFKED